MKIIITMRAYKEYTNMKRMVVVKLIHVAIILIQENRSYSLSRMEYSRRVKIEAIVYHKCQIRMHVV